MENKFIPIEREGYTLAECDLEYLLDSLEMNEYSSNLLVKIAEENNGKVKCYKSSLSAIEKCSKISGALKMSLSDVILSNTIHGIYGIDTDDSSYMKVRE